MPVIEKYIDIVKGAFTMDGFIQEAALLWHKEVQTLDWVKHGLF